MRGALAVLMLSASLSGGCISHYTAVPVERTPYDEEWDVIRRSMDKTWRLRYLKSPSSSRVWQSPIATAIAGGGDCTALATFLYCELLLGGVSDARIVFGFMGRQWHAWVEWRGHILDPTLYRVYPPGEGGIYQPYWGYDMRGKYRFIETDVSLSSVP